MPPSKKTFQVRCHHCDETFSVAFSAAESKAKGSGEVVIPCPYCHTPCLVELEREYIEESTVIRSRESGLD